MQRYFGIGKQDISLDKFLSHKTIDKLGQPYKYNIQLWYSVHDFTLEYIYEREREREREREISFPYQIYREKDPFHIKYIVIAS